jgi:hypothetical protein
VEDFDARGGRAAYLHTGYDSPAHHIYRRAGFTGYLATGIMERFPDPTFHQDFWAPRPVSVRDTRWADWALLEALYGVVDGWYLRSVHMGQWGRAGYEGQYVHARKQMAEGKLTQMKVLEASNGAVVGHAYLAGDYRFRGDVWTLEFFLHPHYTREAGRLLGALDLDLGVKVQAYAEETQPERAEMLLAAGFAPEVTLKRHVRRGDEWLDVSVFAR